MPHYEKGTYRANVTGQRFGVTPNKTPYFAVSFEPTSALGMNSFPSEVFERELTLYFSDKAAPYSIEHLRRLGWNGTHLTDLDPDTPNFHSLAGTEVEVVCDYSDKGYEDWNLKGTGSNGAAKESTKGVAAKLDRLFGKALKSAMPKPQSEITPQPTVVTVPDDDEDDVPF